MTTKVRRKKQCVKKEWQEKRLHGKKENVTREQGGEIEESKKRYGNKDGTKNSSKRRYIEKGRALTGARKRIDGKKENAIREESGERGKQETVGQ